MKVIANGIAIVEGDSHIGTWVQESGRLDHDLTVEQYILPLLKLHYWVVDAGADIGSHTIRYAQAVPEGRVLAFEPNRDEYECLQYNLRDYSNTHCYPVALSNRTEMTTLRLCENVGAGYLDRSVKGKIACMPLDSFNLPALDFFKIDVEGYELYVLQGAERTIRFHQPKILVEMNAGTLARNSVTYSQIFEFLAVLGYSWKSFAQDVDPMNTAQYDLLATPKTKTT